MIRTINSGVCTGSGSAAGFFSCCFPWDTCLPSGFCRANTTYYTALCTDQTLQDEVCQRGCGGLYRTSLQYDTGSASWKCCNQEDRTCSTATNATFDAPAPQQLLAQTRTIVDFIPTSTAALRSTSSTPRTSTSSSTNSSTSSTSPVSTSASSSAETIGLSTGARAGIGAGLAVLVIGLIAGLVWWLLKRKKNGVGSINPFVPTSSDPGRYPAGELSADSRSQGVIHEKHAPAWAAEFNSFTSDAASQQPRKGVHEVS